MESKLHPTSPITKKKSEFYSSGDSSEETAPICAATSKLEEYKQMPVLSSYKET